MSSTQDISEINDQGSLSRRLLPKVTAVGGFGCLSDNGKDNEIEKTPTFGPRLDMDHILGMTKMKGGVKISLDIDKVLSAKEVTLLDKVIQGISEFKKDSEERRKKNVTPI